MRERTPVQVIFKRAGARVRRARALAPHQDDTETAMNAHRDESGAVLVLALVFLIAVSLIVTGLLTLVGTSLTDSGSLTTNRNMESAATDAVNLAIQNTRYTFDKYSLLDAAGPQSCLTDGSNPGYPVVVATGAAQTYIDVYCSMVWQPDNASGYTRTITYSACLSGGSAAACAAAPFLQAVVAFDDNPPGAVAPSINPTQCTPIVPNSGNCGESMTQLSWQWNPVVPVVNSISPTSGPTAPGTTITINGTGFQAAETVNFLWESGGKPVSPSNTSGYNPPVQATIITNPPSNCAVPTCLQVTTPSVIMGSTYFVTVTTPGGTSAFSAVFTYNPVQPVVAGLSGAVTGGSVTGGNTVTIEGTGFWSASSGSPALVYFCPETGGGGCTPSPSNAGSGVVTTNGSPYQSITALSPPVGPSGQGTYYVQVVVNNQKSPLTSQAAAGSGLWAPVFTYSVLVPIVTSVTPAPPTPVAVGGSITINGYNFVTGITVGFCAVTTTAPYYSASCVGPNEGGQSQTTNFSIVNTTQIVVTVPTTLPAGTYYPIVGLPPYSGVDQPGSPYNEPADEFVYS